MQAKSLVFNDEPPRMPMMKGMMKGMPPMPPMAAWQPAAPYRGPHVGMQPSKVSEGQGMQGIVLSFNPGKGFGFIRCANASGDVYFKDNTGKFVEGAPISFHVRITPDGKLRARDVSPGLAAGETYSV